MSMFSDIFKGGIKDAVGGLGEAVKVAVGAFKADPTKLAELEAQLTQAAQAHEQKMLSLANEAEAAYLKDMDSARAMQTAALGQADLFSKRFVYYLAAAVVLIVALYDFCLFWVHYPEANRDLVNMVAGILNSSALVMILSFFYGSSKGSKDAGERMHSMLEKMSDSKG